MNFECVAVDDAGLADEIVSKRTEREDQRRATRLHVLEDGFIRIGHRELLVVRVRLLAVDNYPAYEVVVGEKPLPNFYSPN
jgi:hypothetical protein